MSWQNDHASSTLAVASPVCFLVTLWMPSTDSAGATGSKGGNGKSMFEVKPTVTKRDRLFVIDGVISLPVAISGFFILPDVPEIANPWYLTKEVHPIFGIVHVSYALQHLLTFECP